MDKLRIKTLDTSEHFLSIVIINIDDTCNNSSLYQQKHGLHGPLQQGDAVVTTASIYIHLHFYTQGCQNACFGKIVISIVPSGSTCQPQLHYKFFVEKASPDVRLIWSSPCQHNFNTSQSVLLNLLSNLHFQFQAVCTEFLIRYPDLIFTSNLPTFSSHTFELGILPAGINQAEIDIDGEIAKRLPSIQNNNKNESAFQSRRPKSLAIVTGNSQLISEIELKEKLLVICKESDKPKFIEVGGGPSALPRDFHTEVKLRRAKSSTIAGGNCLDQRYLDSRNRFVCSFLKF